MIDFTHDFLARRFNHTVIGLGAGLLFAASSAYAFDMPDYAGVDELPAMSFTFASNYSPTSGGGKTDQAFMDYVEAASKGKITFSVLWSGSLLGMAETAQGVASGTADIAYVLTLYTPADFPINNWMTMLASESRGGMPLGYIATNGALNEFFATNAEVRKEIEDFGLHILNATGGNAYDLTCTSPVTNLDQAKGKRTRAGGQSFSREAEALGMVPVAIIGSETFEALSRGVVDCNILQPRSNYNQGYMDIPNYKYWTSIEMTGYNAGLLVMNGQKWDSLPPLAQQILSDANIAYLEAFMTEDVVPGTRAFGDLIRNGSVVAAAVDDNMRQVLRDFQESQIALMPSVAPAGVTDPEGFIAQYRALIDKWQDIARTEFGIEPESTDITQVVDSWYVDHDYVGFAKRIMDAANAARSGGQ